jgi:hypothetical protein
MDMRIIDEYNLGFPYEQAIIFNKTDWNLTIHCSGEYFTDSVKIAKGDSLAVLTLFQNSPMAHFARHGPLSTFFNALEFSQIKIRSELGQEKTFFPNTNCPNPFRIVCWENDHPKRSVFKIEESIFN